MLGSFTVVLDDEKKSGKDEG
jgi:hypothetical protein